MQQVAGNQPAHAQVAANNDVHPGDDNRHAAGLLQPRGKVHRHIGERFHPQLKLAELAGEMLPLILALALGVINLNGIEAGQRFHQHRLTLVRQLVGFFDPRHQRTLDQPVHPQRQRIAEHRDPHQRSADHRDHHQNQQREGKVDKGRQGQRREELSNRLELLEVLRKAAHPRRAQLHLHSQQPLEQRRGDHQIGFFARQIEANPAQNFQHKVEHVGNQDADRHHPQGGSGLVRYHPVIDVHHKQRGAERHQVDQETGHHRIEIQGLRQLQRILEPGFSAR
ncbi:hypothetical protein D3C75_439490 [compost metagenome]